VSVLVVVESVTPLVVSVFAVTRPSPGEVFDRRDDARRG
jgi:hypothetical protein